MSKAFMDDFDYLSNLYKWDADDIVEMKNWVRINPDETVPYITGLANQWRKTEGLA